MSGKGLVRWLLWFLIPAFLVAVVAVTWLIVQGELVRTVYRDGGALRYEDGTVRLRKVVWEPPRAVPGGAAEIAAPGRALVAVALPSSRGDHDLFLRRIQTDGWSVPVPLPGSVNTGSDELSPTLSPSGDLLIFASDRPGGLGKLDLWLARREARGWETVGNLGRKVNSPFNDSDPTLSLDVPGEGGFLVFATNRPRGFLLSPPEEWLDIPLEGRSEGDWNLAAVPLKPDENGHLQFGLPQALQVVNTLFEERAPAFSPAGRFLYFASDRPGGHGGFDLYRSRRLLAGRAGSSPATLTVEEPRNLGLPLNSQGDETSPLVFEGGFAIAYVESTRPQGQPKLVESRSLEVEEEVEIASLWLEAVAVNLPSIAALLFGGAVLALALSTALRTRSSWAASLLTRCAIVAILVHLGLFYAFCFWRVGRRVAVAVRERVEEFSVDRMLAARITAEAHRQVPVLPEPERPVAQRRQAEPEVETSPLLTPQLSRVPEQLSPGVPSATELELAVRPPEVEVAHRPNALERPERPEPSAVALPEPEPASAVSEERAKPRREAEPLVLEETVPDGKTLPLADVPASIAQPRVAETVIGAARTPVFAPDPARLLPTAAAEPLPDPAQRLERLPVEAQSPVVGEAREPPLDRRATSPGDARASETVLEPESLARPTRLELPVGRWESLPLELPSAAKRESPSASLPEIPRLPGSRPYRVATSRLQLPETVPAAARSAAGGAAEELARKPSQSDPDLESQEGPAPWESPVAAAKVRPLSAVADRAHVVTRAAVAHVDRVAVPGRPLAVPEPRAPAASPHRALPEIGGPRLPEAAGPGPTGEASLLARKTVPALERFRDSPPAAEATRSSTSPSLVRPVAALRPPPPQPLTPKPKPPVLLPAPVSTSPLEPKATSVARLPEAPPGPLRSTELRRIRSAESRQALVDGMGGSKESESAVRLALAWLARHQSIDGRWDVDGFDSLCGECRSPGLETGCDVAITGLVVLCFLGHNEVPGGQGAYARNVQRGLEWLLAQRGPDGHLAGEDRKYTMYSHGIATLALSEAYLMSRDSRYSEPLRAAVDLIIRAQNTRTGGWRYHATPPRRGDTSVSGWQVMALRSAAASGIEIPETVFERSRRWFDEEVGGGDWGGVYGYSQKTEPRVAMTAEGMFARQLLGGRRGDGNVEESARYINTATRDGQHLDNLYLLYYGTMALYQHQGWIWQSWNSRVRDFLVRKQHTNDHLSGSWDPHGPWLAEGGRVLATAFATLTLEVYYRYLPLSWGKDFTNR